LQDTCRCSAKYPSAKELSTSAQSENSHAKNPGSRSSGLLPGPFRHFRVRLGSSRTPNLPILASQVGRIYGKPRSNRSNRCLSCFGSPCGEGDQQQLPARYRAVRRPGWKEVDVATKPECYDSTKIGRESKHPCLEGHHRHPDEGEPVAPGEVARGKLEHRDEDERVDPVDLGGTRELVR